MYSRIRTFDWLSLDKSVFTDTISAICNFAKRTVSPFVSSNRRSIICGLSSFETKVSDCLHRVKSRIEACSSPLFEHPLATPIISNRPTMRFAINKNLTFIFFAIPFLFSLAKIHIFFKRASNLGYLFHCLSEVYFLGIFGGLNAFIYL